VCAYTHQAGIAERTTLTNNAVVTQLIPQHWLDVRTQQCRAVQNDKEEQQRVNEDVFHPHIRCNGCVKESKVTGLDDVLLATHVSGFNVFG